ncbi:MAG TPA: AraC family ligand binding domain-containing protein [Gaiellaceae bacterium]|nr:AraC family ligand binding domain-containing protein [Gaiellaceae bacterium]
MSGRSHETARIADLERPNGWSPIRLHFDVQAFGVNAWTGREPGATVIGEHDERTSGHEELYVVVAGRATFTVGTEEVDAPTGTLVFVPDPETMRGAVAAEPGTTVLTVGGTPGAAYVPRAWETNFEVIGLFEEGRHEEARQRLLDALPRYEDRGALLYNLACAEAQLGNPDAAFERLRAAFQERDDLAESARTDTDLDPLRSDARFAELVA